MRKRALAFLALAALAMLAPAAARADLTMVMKADSISMTSYLTADKLREEIGATQVFIYRGDKQLMWMLNPALSTYSEMTSEDLAATREKLDGMQAQMKEAMKNMPPEQRAMMEKMMKDRMPKAAVEVQRTVKATGETKAVNGYPCAEYIVTTDKGSSDVWATDPTKLGIDPKDLGVLKGFGEFMSAMSPGAGMRDLTKDFEHPKPDEVPGFPVLMISKDSEGNPIGRFELVKVEKGSLAADKFNLPAGFKKESSPFQMSPYQK